MAEVSAHEGVEKHYRAQMLSPMRRKHKMGDFNFYIQIRWGAVKRPTCHRKITYLSSPRQQFERHASPRPWVLEFLFHCSLLLLLYKMGRCCCCCAWWRFRSVGNLRSLSETIRLKRHLSFARFTGSIGAVWSVNEPYLIRIRGIGEDPVSRVLDFQNPTSINMSARWWVQRAAINS